MKTLFIGALLCLSVCCQAQSECDGNRYINPIFNDVDSTTDIVYGSNTTIGGNQKTLRFDVYYPSEFFFNRPLVIVAHGGSFIAGTRKYLRPLCLELAKRGFVAATIDYRLFDAFALPLDSNTASDVALKASMDMKAAIRWFRENAKGANNYGIDTTRIISGGISAGAITALHAAYLDTFNYAPGGVIDSIIEANGGIRGNTTMNHQFSDSVLAVLNYSGAMRESHWVDPFEPQLFSVHDDMDSIVPYGQAITFTTGWPIELHGSAAIHEEAKAYNLRSQLITVENSEGHVSYFAENSPYYEKVIDSTSIFLEYAVCDRIQGLRAETRVSSLRLYPNPAHDVVTIQSLDPVDEVVVTSMDGSTVLRSTSTLLDVSSLPPGTYFIACMQKQARIGIKRFVKQ